MMAEPRALTSRYAITVLLTLIIAMSLVPIISPVAAEDQVPTITLTVNSESRFQTVDVAWTQKRPVVSGHVDVTNILGPETIKVTIEDTPWDGSVEERTEQVTNAMPDFDFDIPITVPKGWTEGDYTGRVVAVWVSSTGDITVKESVEITFRVRSIPFQVDTNPSFMLVDPGDTKQVSIEIMDETPMGLTYLCQAGEVTAPDNPKWLDRVTRWLDLDSVAIEAGGSDYLTLEIVIPEDATTATMEVPVQIQAEDHPEFARTTTVTVQVQGVPIKPPISPDEPWLPVDPMILFTLVLVVVAIGFIGFIGFTEVGLLMVLWGLLMPLFTRLKRDQVLNQFTRGEIFGFIKANPGVHLTAIKENLGLANGVLAYHLKVLIREEFIVARSEGGYKRFYPRDMRVPRKRVHFTRLQLDIVEKLSLHPGSTQASLARMLGESKQVINYNVGVLVAAGVVRVEREGSKTLLFVEDGTALRPQVQVAELVEEGTEDEDRMGKGAPSPVRWQ
jgi:predicted transcriptional regulator